jgi:hypothetical protein
LERRKIWKRFVYKEESIMKTFSAIYKGDRVIELSEDIDLPEDTEVLVVIPEQDNERTLRSQLQNAAETAFKKLWDNEADEVWNEYL